MNANPFIYVACLRAYNHGQLHGCWIDATLDVDDIQAEIQAMLVNSPIAGSEDYAIHDTDNFEGLHISEYESLKAVHEYALFINEYGALGAAVLDYYADIDAARIVLTDYYHGEWDSELEYARELFDECWLHEVPESIHAYIDYQAFCRDLFINDYFSVNLGRTVHVFTCY